MYSARSNSQHSRMYSTFVCSPRIWKIFPCSLTHVSCFHASRSCSSSKADGPEGGSSFGARCNVWCRARTATAAATQAAKVVAWVICTSKFKMTSDEWRSLKQCARSAKNTCSNSPWLADPMALHFPINSSLSSRYTSSARICTMVYFKPLKDSHRTLQRSIFTHQQHSGQDTSTTSAASIFWKDDSTAGTTDSPWKLCWSKSLKEFEARKQWCI